VAGKQAEVERLVAQLSVSKREYAAAFLKARTEGTEMTPGKPSTVDDARMWARRNIAARGIADPEMIRWQLAAIVGAVRMSDD